MGPNEKPIIIAIDGPAGAGKSSVAKALAKRLNLSYLDTGAMYRALTLKTLTQNVDLNDTEAIIALAKETHITLKPLDGAVQVMLDDEDVSQAIREPNVTNNTSYIANIPEVRAIMVGWQRDIAQSESVVVEGRDVGTVVFPDTPYKFYMDADINERMKRRLLELQAKGKTVEEQKLIEDMKKRDHNDTTREAGPLKQAEDAIYIDSTHMDINQSVDAILEHIK